MENFEAMLNEKLKSIKKADEKAEIAAEKRWSLCAHPLGSLGEFEKVVSKIAALTGNEKIDVSKKALLVFCADNGVVSQGVSQSESTVTTNIVMGLVQGKTAVCKMAEVAKCDVFAIDVGVKDFCGNEKVLNERISNGTEDFTKCPAMTREEAARSVLCGIKTVEKMKEAGFNLLATGEAGIGNTTTSAAISCVLLEKEPKDVVGRGAGLSDEGLRRKIDAIERGLKLNLPDKNDPIDVLAKVGGFDIGAMCGAFLGGAIFCVPVIADGFISQTAALLAARLCPDAKKAIILSHLSAEKASPDIVSALGGKPLISAGLRLGEGSGAVAAMPLIDMAKAVYDGCYSFEECGIEEYKPLGGF